MAAVVNFAQAFPSISTESLALTATPGGTQAAGLVLTSRYNRVSVCATGGDSVVLPPLVPDLLIYVANDGAAALNVFPALGQIINVAAVNAAFSVTIGKPCLFVGGPDRWATILSA
jgi:hypothetical protein